MWTLDEDQRRKNAMLDACKEALRSVLSVEAKTSTKEKNEKNEKNKTRGCWW